jgi:hypothetical protein
MHHHALQRSWKLWAKWPSEASRYMQRIIITHCSEADEPRQIGKPESLAPS